jgi:hypothetical protein
MDADENISAVKAATGSGASSFNQQPDCQTLSGRNRLPNMRPFEENRLLNFYIGIPPP